MKSLMHNRLAFTLLKQLTSVFYYCIFNAINLSLNCIGIVLSGVLSQPELTSNIRLLHGFPQPNKLSVFSAAFQDHSIQSLILIF